MPQPAKTVLSPALPGVKADNSARIAADGLDPHSGHSFEQKRPSLCTYAGQVRGVNYNAIQVKELCKDEVVDWLFLNGHLKDADSIDRCGQTFVHLEDINGHEKYGRMHCSHDYCPRCGKNDSSAHKRRVVRAVDRLIWADILGYMVFTLPKEVSLNMPDSDKLSVLLKKAWEIVKKNFSTPGGMSRVHLMGEEPEHLHIHINVLFPVLSKDGKGKVSQETLDNVRNQWTKVVNDEFGMENKETNIFYKFALEIGRKLHRIKYVLRPIVTPEKFLTLSEEDRHKVLSLKGWHNTRWYGKLANSQYKKYLASIGVEIAEKQAKDLALSKNCPVCGEKYRFIEIVSEKNIPKHKLRFIDNDMLVDMATFAYLQERGAFDG